MSRKKRPAPEPPVTPSTPSPPPPPLPRKEGQSNVRKTLSIHLPQNNPRRPRSPKNYRAPMPPPLQKRIEESPPPPPRNPSYSPPPPRLPSPVLTITVEDVSARAANSCGDSGVNSDLDRRSNSPSSTSSSSSSTTSSNTGDPSSLLTDDRSSSQCSRDSLEDVEEGEASVGRTLRSLTLLREELASLNTESDENKVTKTRSTKRRSPPPPPHPPKPTKSPAPPPPPPEFCDDSLSPQLLGSVSPPESFDSDDFRMGGSKFDLLLRHARETLRRQSSNYPDEKPLEKSLEDRLQSFHLNEDFGEADSQDLEEDFAGVRVLSPFADNVSVVDKNEERRDGEEEEDSLKGLTIKSSRGTVRGVRNRVRQGIATFLRDPSKRVSLIDYQGCTV